MRTARNEVDTSVGRGSEAGLADRLVRAVPELEPVLRDHVDYFEELLPHVFMGEVTPLVVEWAESGEPDQRARAVIEKLEEKYGHDYQVDELIAVSFVENLPRAEDPGGDVLTLLRPQLREVQLRMHGLL